MIRRKIGIIKIEIIYTVCFFITSVALAQAGPGKLEEFLNDGPRLRNISLRYLSDVNQFYKKLQYHPVWTEDNFSQQYLLSLLKRSSDYGLNAGDYQPGRVVSIENYHLSPANSEDSIISEIQLTDALIHFLHDIVYGNTPVRPGYNGLDYSPGCLDISSLLAEAVINSQLSSLPASIEQKTNEYDSLKRFISGYNRIIGTTNFNEEVVTSVTVNGTNKPLLTKLFQLGLIDSATQKLTDKELKEKVKKAQMLFNLLADGILRSTTIEAFNVPLANRLKEINNAINAIRWMNCIKQSQKVIVVNIPSANLLVYENGTVILESRVIVGKRSTPTPTLCSKITEVDLYPYWMAPYSIATKELLPSIKKNIGYLDANGYQVINKQGRVVNPYKIDWQALNASNFPYTIRQSTGCDNALGLVKLNFYNPHSVYLHDTPNKSLFSFNKRYFSHGCIRVEKAMEKAHLVLKNNGIAIDTLEAKGCLYNQSPIIVSADEIIPVFVLYNTAWVDSTGRVSFSEDIYRKNQFYKKKN